jgi:hypothetical protein
VSPFVTHTTLDPVLCGRMQVPLSTKQTRCFTSIRFLDVFSAIFIGRSIDLVFLGHYLNSRFLLHPLLSDVLATRFLNGELVIISDCRHFLCLRVVAACIFFEWIICLLLTCFCYLFEIWLKGQEMTNLSEHWVFSDISVLSGCGEPVSRGSTICALGFPFCCATSSMGHMIVNSQQHRHFPGRTNSLNKEFHPIEEKITVYPTWISAPCFCTHRSVT